MANTRLTKTFSSSGNRNKWTISMWIKRSKISATQTLFACLQNNNYKTRLEIAADDELYFNDEYNGNTNGRIVSNAKLRDTNAWYHIVGIWDKDNSTSGDKIRFYINGERVTSFSDTGNAPSNASTLNTDSLTHEIGAENNGNKFDGVMSHIHFCDGYAYEPSNFGSTDSTTGEWKINTSPSVSYGTDGFFILKDGNSVTDQSPNTNNWTISGTLTKTEDCPSNVFATMNNLHNFYESGTYAYGNNQITTGGSNKYTYNNSTLGMETGKYYAEFKWISGGTDILFGLTDRYTTSSTHELGHYDTQYGYRTNGTVRNNNGNLSGVTVASWTTGDIIGVAYDATNKKLYFSKNGTWQNSGDPTSGSTGTGAISVSASPQDGLYYFSTSGYDDASCVLQANFGNGYFGTTAVSSAGTNASNNGIFEYDVPSGYSALSTKGLNE